MATSRRHVTVRVGTGRPTTERRRNPRLVIVGIAHPAIPWLTDVYPEYKVRATRHRQDGAAVEHIRLPSGSNASKLPGFDSPLPTRIRDSVELVMASGLHQVEIVMARSTRLLPWQLWHQEAFELLDPFLSELRSTVVVFPDAPGPPDIGPRAQKPETRLINLTNTVRRWARPMMENYQVGLVDLPHAPEHETIDAMKTMAPGDFGLCTWEGPARPMRKHGWRSAAAHVGGLMATSKQPSYSLLGVRAGLPGGRELPRTRWPRLGIVEPPTRIPDSVRDDCVRLLLDPGGRHVLVDSEPTIRQPVGSWSLPLIRTVKLIHHRVQIAANLFVFRETTEKTAQALHIALQLAFADFVKQQIVKGPDDQREPLILTRADPNPTYPALLGQISAYLRPWLRELRVNLSVRPGEPPRIEVA